MARQGIRVTVAPGSDGPIGEALRELLLELGGDIQDSARRVVPWLSGDLHDDIDYEVEEIGGGAMQCRVGSNLDYALTVEYGDPSRPGYPVQPYLGPALYQVRGR